MEDSLEKKELDQLIGDTIIELESFITKFPSFNLDDSAFNLDGKSIKYDEYCQNMKDVLNILLKRPFVYYSMRPTDKQKTKQFIQSTKIDLKDIINGIFENSPNVTDQVLIRQSRAEKCRHLIYFYYKLHNIVRLNLSEEDIVHYVKIEENSQELFKKFRTTFITITGKQIFMLIGVLWALWWYIPDVFLIKWEVYKINTLIPIWTITIGLVVWIWPFEEPNDSTKPEEKVEKLDSNSPSSLGDKNNKKK